jgi:hypothetical protein
VSDAILDVSVVMTKPPGLQSLRQGSYATDPSVLKIISNLKSAEL